MTTRDPRSTFAPPATTAASIPLPWRLDVSVGCECVRAGVCGGVVFLLVQVTKDGPDSAPSPRWMWARPLYKWSFDCMQ